MTETCMKCNENSVDITELYCQHCSLDLLAEAGGQEAKARIGCQDAQHSSA